MTEHVEVQCNPTGHKISPTYILVKYAGGCQICFTHQLKKKKINIQKPFCWQTKKLVLKSASLKDTLDTRTEFVVTGHTSPPLTLTCTVAPPQNQPWLGWSPGGKHYGSRSYNTPALSHTAVHLYAVSPLCIWPSPSGLQCGCKSEGRSQITD